MKLYLRANKVTNADKKIITVIYIKWDYGYYQPWSDNEWLVDEIMALLNKDITMQ